MRRPAARCAALALVGLVAACDDGTVVSHVGRDPHVAIGDLRAMQEAGAVPVEVHGAPFANVTDADLAQALRPPSGPAQDVRFRAMPVGHWTGSRHGQRVVLHFNATTPPNAPRDCRLVERARTDPPLAVGFSVNMSLCNGDRAIAHGFLQATKAPPGDWEEYTRVMRALMLNIFREEKDR